MQKQPTARRNPLTRLTINLHDTYHNIDKIRAKQQLQQLHPQLQQQQPAHQSCDDEKNDYIFIQGEVWMDRFKLLKLLGKGSFGQVFEATDLKSEGLQNVAIKVIKNRKSFYNQALSEIRILELLNERDADNSKNIVRMKEHFVFRNHLCIVYELLSVNLYEVLKSGKFTGLSLHWIRKVTGQILESLKLLSRPDVQVIHCDLKPENILMCNTKRPQVKVIDFGSSCFIHERTYTYIQSRFYRSPEVILGLPYAMPIDMWSLGCILYELFSGEPLFSGQTEHDQFLRIMDLVGLPPRSMLDSGAPQKVSAMFHKSFVNLPLAPSYPNKNNGGNGNTGGSSSAGGGGGNEVSGGGSSSSNSQRYYKPIVPASFQSRNTTLHDLLYTKFQRQLQQGKNVHPLSHIPAENGMPPNPLHVYASFLADYERFANLVSRMLVYDPKERITPEEALQHPFLKKPVVDRETNTIATMKSNGGNIGYTNGGNSGRYSTRSSTNSAGMSKGGLVGDL
ncbi:UNVERIFIED_CONTAM: Dual specificity tyrosine-phosphorylation-regulated kinase 1A [Siphonaria sp. JEL0065]|nr:Dual specificity tyrosine-phosphorylation-regulated kinase 1A [Siphonaria sp. JEL0065]